MDRLLAMSRGIDRVSWYAGLVATWAILIVTLLAAGDALMTFGLRPLDAANQWLNGYGIGFGFLLDWYRANSNAVGDSLPLLFAVMVMLGAPWTFKLNGHVRVDLLYQMHTPRGRIWIDVIGGLVFLLPVCVILFAYTWPWFLHSWQSNEMSTNAGGLPRWPSRLFLPLGFALLALQGVSELIKCWAALTTGYVREHIYEKPVQ